MQKRLEELLQRFVGSQGVTADARWSALLEAVDADYRQADEERNEIRRSMARASAESTDQNRLLQSEIEVLHATTQSLRLAELSLLNLMSGSVDPVLLHRNGSVVFANEAAGRFLGRSPASLSGVGVVDLLHADDRAGASVQILSTRWGAPSPLGEVRFVHADGHPVFAELISVPVQYETGPATMVVARDMTERRRMQERLLVSDRMASLGVLAAGVAHEINNPLAYIMSNIAYVREGLSGLNGHEMKEFAGALSEALEGATRVKNIVNDLKLFSRPKEDSAAPTDLCAVLRTAINMARREIQLRAQLVTDVPDDLPDVGGSPSRLGQVFLNLLVNAAQAIAPGRAAENRISLRATADAERVTVEVSDTGAGMTSEVRKRIFDPFFTTKPVGVGTGLGLAICHGILDGMGGDIEVESTPGRGTTFRVTLPVVAEHAVEAVKPAAPLAPPRRRVLIVDDEHLVISALKRQLGGFHDVTAVSSAQEAVDALSKAEFDAILLDLMMPEMTGVELQLELEQRGLPAASRTVFMSGGATADMEVFLQRFKGRVLDKPVELTQMCEAIERVAASHVRGP